MFPSSAIRLGSLTVGPKLAVFVGCAYVMLYVALDRVSYVDPMGPVQITAWNPPTGLSLFLLLRFGMGMTPWLFVAAVVAQLAVRGLTVSWELVVASSLLLTAGYAIVGAVLRKRLDFENGIASLRDVTVFVSTAIPGTLLIASSYVGLFVAFGIIGQDALIASVAQLWIGDLIGVVVTTPLLLALTRVERVQDRAPWWETALQTVAVLAALWIVFGSGLGAELKLFYVLFLPLIWIAMRRGVRGATVTTLVIQVGLISALLLGDHAPGVVLDFQFLMLTLALTGLFLSASVEDREQSDAKLRVKQFELNRSLRMAAASELASTLAHELNQPLSAIASYTQSCQILLHSGDPERELSTTMDKVVAEVRRAGSVVRRLREFVRTGTLQHQRIQLSQLLCAGAEATRERAIRHNVTVAVDAPPGLPEIVGDRIQLETVLLNLITNAIDALSTTRHERVVDLTARRSGEDQVQIVVADTGPGLAPELNAVLFQPVATTKLHGMGLGLAISRTIVEAHGGHLRLEPAPSGATFVVTLPISPRADA